MGVVEGLSVGDVDGLTVGALEGLALGEAVGVVEGLTVGEVEGLGVGSADGFKLEVGEVVGPWVGLTLGDAVGEVFMDRYDMIYFELEKHIKDRVHYYISSHISSLTVGDAVGPLVGLNVVGEAFINQVEYDGE